MTPSRIAKVILVLIALFILYWIFFGKKSTSSSENRWGGGFLNLRKGKDYCVKMCGSADNKACMDECKTKTGFYGCC